MKLYALLCASLLLYRYFVHITISLQVARNTEPLPLLRSSGTSLLPLLYYQTILSEPTSFHKVDILVSIPALVRSAVHFLAI